MMTDISDFWGDRFFEYDPIIRIANDWMASNPEWAIPLLEIVFEQARRSIAQSSIVSDAKAE
ncbi:hypothetical protein [Paraburkholderia tropica]|uniref:hypothetical protein n=1 Tax=Paraburkholderia tropica TaxID=92647 RepID=UPI003D27E78A